MLVHQRVPEGKSPDVSADLQRQMIQVANVHIPRRQGRVHGDEAAVTSHEFHQTNAVGLRFTGDMLGKAPKMEVWMGKP